MILPKISVIIPNYNHGRYLRQRIESVLHQTYPNFEVIILDDFSSDNSREIIEDYVRNPLVKEVIFNDKNSGNPFWQWKRGIDLSSGEWIWLAESDDYADQRFLQMLIDALQGRTNIGLLYCDSKIVTDDTVSLETFATIKNKKVGTRRWSENYSNHGVAEIEDYLLPGGTINNTSAVLFNKKVLMEANPFDMDLRYIGDKYAFTKVLAKSDVVYVKESLNYYRDPFNTKHADRFIFYFYEQFLVFDWVSKNLKMTNRAKFLKGFYANTSNSLFRDWNTVKLSLYRKLFILNPNLLYKSIVYNFSQSIRSAMGRTNQSL